MAARLGGTDRRILGLAVDRGGTFSERDLEGPGTGGLGVGEVLDCLASLRDRGLVSLNGDGSFSVTDLGRGALCGGGDIPTRTRILRLLRTGSCGAERMAAALRVPEDGILEAVGELRRDRLVMMSTQRRPEGTVRTYEILPEGAAELDGEGAGGRGGARPEAGALIDEIARRIRDLDAGEAEKRGIAERLSELRRVLEV